MQKMDRQIDLIDFRKQLHKNPELSGLEVNTRQRIEKFFSKYFPMANCRSIGKHSLMVVLNENQADLGTTAFRAELDALPILEINNFDHASLIDGVSHKCGHDGHMTILLKLALKIQAEKQPLGKIILLFQSAEETGQGANQIVKDAQFPLLKEIDYLFALHNIPGFPLKEIVLNPTTFSSASVGLKIELKGKTSHAAHPENGINPAIAVAQLIHFFEQFKDFRKEGMATICMIDVGEDIFGTSAGKAIINITLRSESTDQLNNIYQQTENFLQEHALKEKLEYQLSRHEYFPALVNNTSAYQLLKEVLNENRIPHSEMSEPFRWSEDFSFLAMEIPSVMFGIGAGEDHPQLHNPDYDFPDELIEPAADLFLQLIKNKNKQL